MSQAKGGDLPYFQNVWGFDIGVQRLEGDRILVTGKRPILEAEVQDRLDPYLVYLASVKSMFGQERTGLNSPHIRFANATTDEALIDFVEDFGPFAPSEIEEIEPDWSEQVPLSELAGRRTSVRAIEDLATLRRERRIYAAALGLIGELRGGKAKSRIAVLRNYIAVIADGVYYWPEQWSIEKKWRERVTQGEIAWYFDSNRYDRIRWMKCAADWDRPRPPRREDYSDGNSYLHHRALHALQGLRTTPYQAGQHVLCELINSFLTGVECVGDHPVESLPCGAGRFAIRPGLYLILKREFLWGGGAIICRNDRCNQFFVSQRSGQVFCSPDCSSRYRQRRYWAARGSHLRKSRRRKRASRGRSSRRGLGLDSGTPARGADALGDRE